MNGGECVVSKVESRSFPKIAFLSDFQPPKAGTFTRLAPVKFCLSEKNKIKCNLQSVYSEKSKNKRELGTDALELMQ